MRQFYKKLICKVTNFQYESKIHAIWTRNWLVKLNWPANLDQMAQECSVVRVNDLSCFLYFFQNPTCKNKILRTSKRMFG